MRTTRCAKCGSENINLVDTPFRGVWIWRCNERLCGHEAEPGPDDNFEIEARRRPWLKEIPDPVVLPDGRGTERFAALGEA